MQGRRIPTLPRESPDSRVSARASKKQDEHPHYMGKRSYAQSEALWREQGILYPVIDPSAECSTAIEQIADIQALNWINARSKGDIVPNEQTRKVKDNLVEWQQRQTQGEFTPLGQDDCLNRALGRNVEHPGRTRGIGSKVEFTRVFGTSTPRSKYTADDPTFQAAVQEEVKKVISNLEARWASKFDEQKHEFE